MSRSGDSMWIEVCFPTLNRMESARRLMRSVNGECAIRVSWEEEPKALTGTVNRLFRQSHQRGVDVSIMLADHLEVQPGCIKAVRRVFTERFPDFDGVVGLNLYNLPPLPGVREYCFLAVGRTYLERFRDEGKRRDVASTGDAGRLEAFCPDYYHFFGDTEFGEYASELGRFEFCEEARVFSHLHTSFAHALDDATHQASRRHVDYDEAARKERTKRGLLWGRTFERLYQGDVNGVVKTWPKVKGRVSV